MSDDAHLKPIDPKAAAAQAAEFLGFAAGVDFDLGDGRKWHLPNPNYMPRDMKKRYTEHLRFVSKDLDKETLATRDPITDKVIEREQTVWPLQYNGELIDEDELLCVALMADDEDTYGTAARKAYFEDGTLPEVYEQFLEAGGIAGQIQVIWRQMNLQMEERIKRDPFRR